MGIIVGSQVALLRDHQQSHQSYEVVFLFNCLPLDESELREISRDARGPCETTLLMKQTSETKSVDTA